MRIVNGDGALMRAGELQTGTNGETLPDKKISRGRDMRGRFGTTTELSRSYMDVSVGHEVL
jgi:hypothetical protein